MTNSRNKWGFTDVARATKTINAQELSDIATNALTKDKTWLKSNRLDGEMWSIQEANNGLTQNGKNINGRILIWINDEWSLIIEDGRHLLEAYGELWRDIPESKISFRNKEAENLFRKIF